jgi:hypothetical protein
MLVSPTLPLRRAPRPQLARLPTLLHLLRRLQRFLLSLRIPPRHTKSSSRNERLPDEVFSTVYRHKHERQTKVPTTANGRMV